MALLWKMVCNLGEATTRNNLTHTLSRARSLSLSLCLSIYLSLTLQIEDDEEMRQQTTTRWRRLIGSPKLQIIFHKRAIKYRSLLREMTYEDKGSYESSPS